MVQESSKKLFREKFEAKKVYSPRERGKAASKYVQGGGGA